METSIFFIAKVWNNFVFQIISWNSCIYFFYKLQWAICHSLSSPREEHWSWICSQIHQEKTIGDISSRLVHFFLFKPWNCNFWKYNFKKFRETDVSFLISGVAREDIQKEIHVLAEMEHTNIIYLHQVYENGQNVILVLEL